LILRGLPQAGRMPALPAYRASLGPRASRPHRVCTTKRRGSSQRAQPWNGFLIFAYVYQYPISEHSAYLRTTKADTNSGFVPAFVVPIGKDAVASDSQ